jgi:TonB-linked SusC/RagA family outer membrane protein
MGSGGATKILKIISMTKVRHFGQKSKSFLQIILTGFILCVVALPVAAQLGITVTGTITDKTGDPLPGVSVALSGTTTGVISDADGKFSITVPDKEAVLLFTFTGYRKQEVIVYDRSALNIVLLEETNLLNEVVVVGYGTQKKVNLTGAISTLSEKALINRPITNSTQALQGINGVYVNQTKGRPGADGATIRIRGVGTLNNNDPLVLVDGVEFPLSDVNPNDIESISVLKDAASAAIYGNRAANGVVLVKTKTGNRNKTQVDYNVYWGLQRSTFYPDVVTNAIQYMEGKDRALQNEGKPAEYGEALIAEYKAGTDPDIYPNTDWFGIMYRNAQIQEHNLRVSGGNEKVIYSISLGYLDQDGVLLNTWAKKYSLNANINATVTKRLNITASIAGNYWDARESAYTADEGNGEGGIMGLLYRGLPMQAPYLSNGTYADQWVRVPGHNFFRNPYALSYEGFRKTNTLRNLVNLGAEYTFPFDIKYKITGAANFLSEGEKYAYPQILLEHPKTHVLTPMGNIPNRGVRQYSRTGLNLTSFQTLNWDKRFKRHDISALAGFSLESFDNGNFNAYNEGYLGNDLTELNAGSSAPAVAGTSSQSRLESFFGRLHYGYNDTYIVEANFRYDGSSRFAKDRRWGFFPSFSGAWRIDQEDFLRDTKWLDNLKLRASWGKLGNQSIALFSYVNAIDLGQNYNFNNTVVSGSAITQISDPTITWETTNITDVGVDIGLFTSRISVELDWFDKKTINILRQVNVPAQVGNLTGPYRNIGSVSNRGFEIALNYQDKIGKLGYSIGGNVTYVKNKVLDIKGNIYYSGVTVTQEGSPINAFYGKQVEGIFQTAEEVANHARQNSQPGDLKYRNIDDSDNIIDNNDRTVIGNSIPKYTYSFNIGVTCKRWELTLFFQGVQGVDTYADGNLAQPYRNGAGVTPEWLTDSWTPENPDARLPRLTTSRGYPINFETSDFWIEDASYLRLKNAQLSYNFPNRWLKILGISRVKVFANAQNYLTFSKFKLGDPERVVTRNGIIDYPIAKAVTGGINLTF